MKEIDINKIVKIIDESRRNLEEKAKGFDEISRFLENDSRFKSYVKDSRRIIKDSDTRIYEVAIGTIYDELKAHENTLKFLKENCESDPEIKPYFDKATQENKNVGGISYIYYAMIKDILHDKKKNTPDILELEERLIKTSKYSKKKYILVNKFDYNNIKEYPIPTRIISIDGSPRMVYLDINDDIIFIKCNGEVECNFNTNSGGTK